MNWQKKYNVRAFPTYLFINGDGEESSQNIRICLKRKILYSFAMDAGDPNKRLTALKQKFEKGENDPEFLKNLAGLTILQ